MPSAINLKYREPFYGLHIKTTSLFGLKITATVLMFLHSTCHLIEDYTRLTEFNLRLARMSAWPVYHNISDILSVPACDKHYFDCMFGTTKRPSLKSVKNKTNKTFEPVSGTRKIL